MLSGKCGRSHERLDRSTRIYGALAPGIQTVVIFLTLLHLRGVMQPQRTHPNASWLHRGGEPANSPQSQGKTLGQIHLRWISISFTGLQPQFGPFLRCKSDHSAPKQSNDGHVFGGVSVGTVPAVPIFISSDARDKTRARGVSGGSGRKQEFPSALPSLLIGRWGCEQE